MIFHELDSASNTFPHMNRRSFIAKSALSVGALAGVGGLLEACGGSASGSGAQSVALKHLVWGRAYEADAEDLIANNFHKKYPNVTIKYENIPTANYSTVVKTRFSNNDGPDIFGLNQSTADTLSMIKVGELVDLSDQPWVSTMTDAAKAASTFNGKVYGISYALNLLLATYNKQVFSKLSLNVPATYEEFLANCDALKRAGIAPIAGTYKDAWTGPIMAYTLITTSVLRDEPDFDAKMRTGQTSFAQSAGWAQALEEIIRWNEKGYFTNGPLGTTYSQGLQAVVDGNAAMILNGDWVISDMRKISPNLGLSTFSLPFKAGPVPAGAYGTPPWSINGQSKHIKEAKDYVAFWASPAGVGAYLSKRGSISALTDVDSTVDPALEAAKAYIKTGTVTMPFTYWPNKVQDALSDGVQGLLSKQTTVAKTLAAMDTAYTQNLNK